MIGDFTGANKRKPGLLEFADGGTFFLDEVCELPVTLQAKLLRVLEDQQLRHLGGNELIQIDVRLISATNRDLLETLKINLIREDFYYRINVVNIHLPPLRVRREDIPLLAKHFLQSQLKVSKKEIIGFHPLVLQQFERYKWPGNIRELENVVEHAITVARGDEIILTDLPTHLIPQKSGDVSDEMITSMSLVELKKRATEDIERKFLIRYLKEYNGNITKLAQKANMTRRNLYNLLKFHGLNAKSWRSKI